MSWNPKEWFEDLFSQTKKFAKDLGQHFSSWAPYAAGGALLIPGVAPAVLGGIGAAGGTVLKLAGGTVQAGKAVIGGVAKAVPTLTKILEGSETILPKLERFFGKSKEEEAGTSATSIKDQLADLLAKLASLAIPSGATPPPGATPPLIEPGVVQEAASTDWTLLALLGVGAYLLMRR